MSGFPAVPRCLVCARDNPGSWSRCPDCAGVQRIERYSPGAAGGLGTGIWRYRDCLPAVGTEISLGEGGTPLVSCHRIAERLGLAEVLVKNEGVNPSLSFKDRAMALGVSLALEFGARGVVAASTGNTAASAAAYAARAGLPCRLLCAADAAHSRKLRIAESFGARIEPVDGDFSDAHAAAVRAESTGWFPLTTTFRNPYLAEAHRTVAREIAEYTDPDLVLVPVGAGPLLFGMHRGFGAHGPRLTAVQAEACAPLDEAWRRGTKVSAAVPGSTIAGAIADPLRGYPDEGELTLDAVRESGGEVRTVRDAELEDAVAELAGEGLSAEPAAAAPLAALHRMAGQGELARGQRVVLVLTGHAAKEVA